MLTLNQEQTEKVIENLVVRVKQQEEVMVRYAAMIGKLIERVKALEEITGGRSLSQKQEAKYQEQTNAATEGSQARLEGF